MLAIIHHTPPILVSYRLGKKSFVSGIVKFVKQEENNSDVSLLVRDTAVAVKMVRVFVTVSNGWFTKGLSQYRWWHMGCIGRILDI